MIWIPSCDTSLEREYTRILAKSRGKITIIGQVLAFTLYPIVFTDASAGTDAKKQYIFVFLWTSYEDPSDKLSYWRFLRDWGWINSPQ